MYFKSPLHPKHNLAPIKYQNVQDIIERDAIPSNVRYLGMKVYVISEDTDYKLVGGILNEHWVEDGTGDVSGYQTQFTQADLVGGILTVQHDLNTLFNITHTTLQTATNQKIDPDGITFFDPNALTVDLRMVEPISGSWTVFVTALSEKGVIINITENRTFNGMEFNTLTLN